MTQPSAIQVTDQLERRIRKPVDALRCIVSCVWIFVLAVAAVAASATTTGAETDIVGASRRLPSALLAVAPPIALFALLILPRRPSLSPSSSGVRCAVSSRRWRPACWPAPRPRSPTSRSRAPPPPGSTTRSSCRTRASATSNALDPYLAGLVAYVTMIGLAGRPAWRNALGLAIGVYAIVQLAALAHHRPVDPDHAAGRPRDRPGRPVRRGLDVAASAGAGHRRGAVRRGPGGDRDPAGAASPAPARPDPGTTR